MRVRPRDMPGPDGKRYASGTVRVAHTGGLSLD